MQRFFWFLLILVFLFRFITSQPIYKDGDRLRIASTLSSQPISYEKTQRVVLEGLVIYLPKHYQIAYGDHLIVEGVVKGKTLERPKLIAVDESENIFIGLRKKIIGFWKSSLPEPHSSLVAGITLGSKEGIPRDFWQKLKNTGTTHVVVASGMNVTLVAGFLLSALVLFLPRKKAVILALIGVWIYSLISGFEAPMVRAAIMGSVGFSAQAVGRLSQAWRALFLSALLMLIVRPAWLGDIGFILSFSATASLMLFGDKIHSLIYFIPGILKEGLATSIAAQIFVAPLLYVVFGQFNLLSPVANALVLWTVPIIMVIGAIAGFVGLIFPLLGSLLLYLCYPLTAWFIWVIGNMS